MRQWRIEDLKKCEHNQGCRGKAANEFLRFSHKKTLNLAHFFIEKGHAVSAVTVV